MLSLNLPSPTEELQAPLFKEKGIRLFIKRDDLIHAEISGNKWRKLKFHIQATRLNEKECVLTFGGAYSNHLAATAAASKENGLRSIGVVRGEELTTSNPTLLKCSSYGMQLHFISREQYKRKHDASFIQELQDQFGEFQLVAEGGGGELGVKGCEEILPEVEEPFDIVCCSAGTGTTAAGICRSLNSEKLLIFPALKGGDFILEEMGKYCSTEQLEKTSLQLDYHFGGYAKINNELASFCEEFYTQFKIKLDLIYTAKLFYGLFDLIKKDYFDRGSNILAIHTGGLQGNKGMEEKYSLALYKS